MARGQVDYLQDQFEESDPVEDESDLRGSSPSELSDAVVQGTDWTTATLLDQIERGRIQLNPNFQRRDAWTRERKSKFIESLMLGFPIPQIVLTQVAPYRGKQYPPDPKAA
jgi:hypothetical protein